MTDHLKLYEIGQKDRKLPPSGLSTDALFGRTTGQSETSASCFTIGVVGEAGEEQCHRIFVPIGLKYFKSCLTKYVP